MSSSRNFLLRYALDCTFSSRKMKKLPTVGGGTPPSHTLLPLGRYGPSGLVASLPRKDCAPQMFWLITPLHTHTRLSAWIMWNFLCTVIEMMTVQLTIYFCQFTKGEYTTPYWLELTWRKNDSTWLGKNSVTWLDLTCNSHKGDLLHHYCSSSVDDNWWLSAMQWISVTV